ncbi:ComF family protein [Streptomyces sp. NRRL F-5126]|uniref:ComF family protein n=1 Tax=Streptomyces sp. NRRL F-5126 TaxID=1463857 RepID=UPI0004C4FB8B|nr:phosphoribosyltransferase [Streptomyces sp. NRRL F-5126]
MLAWWRELGGLVLPAACTGCGDPGTTLCEACRRALYGARPRRVRPASGPAGLPPVHAAAPYEGAVREVVLAHKERGALELAAPLGAALAGAVAAAVAVPRGARGGGLLLVPVPSTPRAVAARGQDATLRAARAAAVALRRAGRAAEVVPVLRQRRRVADQAGLDPGGRRANLSGALEVVRNGPRLLGRGRVVLVDDVMTTGVSLAEAARAVDAARRREAGIRAVRGGMSAAVIAAPRPSFEINRN